MQLPKVLLLYVAPKFALGVAKFGKAFDLPYEDT
jgi:hypothetical protein